MCHFTTISALFLNKTLVYLDNFFSREASMNFVFLSPHFPPNYLRFAVALKKHELSIGSALASPGGKWKIVE